MAKGCLSNIPIHISTSGNERLHRHMNNVLKINKIGLETAYVRCSKKINNKGSCDESDDSISSLSAFSKSLTDFSKRAEHFGFQNVIQNNEGLAIPTKGVQVYNSLEARNAEILCRIRDTISVSLQNDNIHNDHQCIHLRTRK